MPKIIRVISPLFSLQLLSATKQCIIKHHLQNPAVHGLQTVTNIGQGASEQDRHSVGHVGFSGLLMELNADNSFAILACVLDQHAPVPILPLAGVLLLGFVKEPRFNWADAGPGAGG